MNIEAVKGAFLLTRPQNILITIFSIFVSAAIASESIWQINVYFAAISAGLIMAGGNVINDVFDVEIDRINKPNRPIPSNLISIKTAAYFSILLFVFGIIIAFLASVRMGVFATFIAIIISLYASHLKRTVIWGNLTVSLASAAVFIYGGMAVNNINDVIYPAIFALLFHFGREIIKDIEDVEGDIKNGAKTLPIVFGTAVAKRWIFINFTLLLFVTVLPFFTETYGWFYFTIIIFGVWTVILFTLFKLRQTTEPKDMKMLSTLLKFDMLIGLIAIFVG